MVSCAAAAESLSVDPWPARGAQAQMCEVSQHGIEGAGEDWAAYDASSQSRVLAEAQVLAHTVVTQTHMQRLATFRSFRAGDRRSAAQVEAEAGGVDSRRLTASTPAMDAAGRGCWFPNGSGKSCGYPNSLLRYSVSGKLVGVI